ncbi:hypothetical protein ACLKA6_003359 [Drosophila palustris]
MNCRQFVFFWIFLKFVFFVCGARGTFGRPNDDTFQMMIAGGILPRKSSYVMNLVSIRTLNYIEYRGDNHFCTGVIVSSRAVLTAAHCVTDLEGVVWQPQGAGGHRCSDAAAACGSTQNYVVLDTLEYLKRSPPNWLVFKALMLDITHTPRGCNV